MSRSYNTVSTERALSMLNYKYFLNYKEKEQIFFEPFGIFIDSMCGIYTSGVRQFYLLDKIR